MIKRLLLASLILCGIPTAVLHAQSAAVVVATCGTPPATYSAGANRQITQDTAGNLCTSASATGTFTDDATGTTGNPVPGSAAYTGLNIGGNLVGQTGVNPSGSVEAAQVDLASVAGATVKTGAGTASGALRVELPTNGTGAVFAAGNTYTNIVTATTTTVKSGAGVLHTVCVNALGTVASSAVVYDNTAGSGTKIATLNTLALLGCQTYDVAFATGLTIVTTGTAAPDITISSR